ncbi:MAG: Gfo/Idh/MocA family oxidoreductase [Planctomycetaceae bacterium]|nr:Gfo/Idh/MocA family oxidoreductase [Planctomycetaceae bacterium]
MTHGTNRRDFMKTSALVSAAWWAAPAPAWSDSKSPVERLNFACIGVDGKGSSDTNDAGRHGNIVALCDIDDNRLQKKALRYPKAKKFNDYREMLSEMGSEIDAVTVTTPDHSHAPAGMMAMKMGKHCFCQKPLTWSVKEARLMRETAAKMKVATQMGNQGTSSDGLRWCVDAVRNGTIGNVKEVHVWTNRPIWPQGTGRPTETPAVPKNVHWDLFLGPAAERPYHPAYHPFNWRGWVDFGTGALGDMACHTVNMPAMALDLFEPTSIEADSPGVFEGETYPKFSTIKFEYPQRGELPACTFYWYDGGKKPPVELLQGQEMRSSGALLVGDKGTLYSQGDYAGGTGKDKNLLLPLDKFAEYEHYQKLPNSPGHFTEFANACKGGEPAMSNFAYAGRLTETILLGNVALRAGGRIEWDAENMKVTNNEAANQYLGREYREGWTL